MHGMYDRLTTETKEIIESSYAEAEHWQHDDLRTEHLLLAMLKVPETLIYRFFEEQGITYARVYTELERIMDKGMRRVSADKIKPTPQCKRIIILAHNAAMQHGQRLIDPEHLLFGLLQEGNREIILILRDLGLSRSKLEQLLGPLHENRIKDRYLKRLGQDSTEKLHLTFDLEQPVEKDIIIVLEKLMAALESHNEHDKYTEWIKSIRNFIREASSQND